MAVAKTASAVHHAIARPSATRGCGRSAPELLETHYAHEIWALYSAGELTPDSVLTGRFTFDETAADVEGVLAHIEDERREAEERQRRILEASE